MYTSFTVRNYRCFEELELTGLKRINLVAGRNNVGKTALLEALFLHIGAYNPTLALKVEAFRGLEFIKVELTSWAEAPWSSLFPDFDSAKTIELVGRDTSRGRSSVRISVPDQEPQVAPVPDAGPSAYAFVRDEPAGYERFPALLLEHKGPRDSQTYQLRLGPDLQVRPTPPPPPFPGVFLGARNRVPPSEDARRFNDLQMAGREHVVLPALRLLEPRLKRLTLGITRGVTTLHGDIGLSRLLPLPDMGEGMVRAASLVLAIASSPGGVVLIDEIENGLHHSLLGPIWHALGEVCAAADVQLFATTHSWENIVAAHDILGRGREAVLELMRLDRVDGSIRAVRYSPRLLQAAIEGAVEVR
jgi:hypothetical protein